MSNVYPVPGADLGTLQASLLSSVPGSRCLRLHLPGEEREAQRDEVTYPRLHS